VAAPERPGVILAEDPASRGHDCAVFGFRVRTLRSAATGARLIQADALDSEAWLPNSQPRLPTHSKSLTGWSGVSTDEFDATRTPGTVLPASPLLITLPRGSCSSRSRIDGQVLNRTVLRLLQRGACSDAVPACIRAGHGAFWSVDGARPTGRLSRKARDLNSAANRDQFSAAVDNLTRRLPLTT
jgi:hypothetical protein